MASNNDLFSLLLVISFLWYICHKKEGKGHKESFVVNNTTGTPSMTADDLYRYNGDLNYASRRSGFRVPFNDNILTQRIAPIINPVTGRIITPDHSAPLGVQQLSHLRVPDSDYSTRIPDDLSSQNSYNIPLPQFNDLQGGFRNTNRKHEYPSRLSPQVPQYMYH